MERKKASELKEAYRRRKPEIRERLQSFHATWKRGSKAIFSELAFCLCTPQSKALRCDSAVRDLRKSNLLWQGSAGSISRAICKKVRFHKNKGSYLFDARSLLMPGIKEKLVSLGIEKEPKGVRNWLAENVRGMGMKEASHFLRNIGFGESLAILDRHILKNLQRYGAIPAVPKALGKNAYLEIEKKVGRFSKRVGIPMQELDLLFWSEETGKVFK